MLDGYVLRTQLIDFTFNLCRNILQCPFENINNFAVITVPINCGLVPEMCLLLKEFSRLTHLVCHDDVPNQGSPAGLDIHFFHLQIHLHGPGAVVAWISKNTFYPAIDFLD